jgi:hypothetical protein
MPSRHGESAHKRLSSSKATEKQASTVDRRVSGQPSHALELGGWRRAAEFRRASPGVKRDRRTADEAGMGASTLVPPARVDSEVVSPELALVDPLLARRARALLVDPTDVFRASEEVVSRSSPAWSRRRALLAGSVLAIALGVLLPDIRIEGSDSTTVASPLEEVAGTDASGTVPPTPQPESEPPAQPRGRASTALPRRFAWAPVAGAGGYHVEFFLGSKKVFAADTDRPQIALPTRWRFRGVERTLEPGDYRWYVWPVVSGRRAAEAIVQARLAVSPS